MTKMKPLSCKERWYAFLMIVYEGNVAQKIPFNHITFGYLADCNVPHEREEEIDDYILELWRNPPETL